MNNVLIWQRTDRIKRSVRFAKNNAFYLNCVDDYRVEHKTLVEILRWHIPDSRR